MSQKIIEEYRQTLKRAFGGSEPADYIHMDGRGAMNTYLRESWNYYVDNGFIKVNGSTQDEQDSFLTGRLTPKGKNWIMGI